MYDFLTKFFMVGLEMHIVGHFDGEYVSSFYPSTNALSWNWHDVNQTASKSFLYLSIGTWAKFGVTRKGQLQIMYIVSPIHQDAPTGAIIFNFSVRLISLT